MKTHLLHKYGKSGKAHTRCGIVVNHKRTTSNTDLVDCKICKRVWLSQLKKDVEQSEKDCDETVQEARKQEPKKQIKALRSIGHVITQGKIYDVCSETDQYFRIISDAGTKGGWLKEHFEIIAQQEEKEQPSAETNDFDPFDDPTYKDFDMLVNKYLERKEILNAIHNRLHDIEDSLNA